MTFLGFMAVVLAVAFADICWTMYFISTEERKSGMAALWSALIMLAGATVTRAYVENDSYISAAILGAFLGTYGCVEWKRRKELQKEQ